MQENCRLCGGPVQRQFALKVLTDVSCEYMKCAQCGSLQTERPHWLERAYRISLTNLDTGAANRCVVNQARVYLFGRILGIRTILDFGGGDGLLTRLLRDLRLDCRVSDRHAQPIYAGPFQHEPGRRYDLVCAFEVIEHLAEPEMELRSLFEPALKHILISTVRYEGQDENWWYLAPSTGQHVFFYTRKALQLIADRFDCKLLLLGEYALFSRAPIRSYQVLLLRLVSAPIACRLLRAYVALKSKHGTASDFERLVRDRRSN